MQFKKTVSGYEATRKDGIVVTIEKTDGKGDMKWRSTYQDDFYGDNTAYAATKKELVELEKRYNSFL